MNRYSSNSLVSGQGAAIASPLAPPRLLVWIAWISTLLLSNLPLVISRDLLGGDLPWIRSAWIGMAGLLIAATFLWPAIKPLQGYFIIMAIICLMSYWVDPLIRSTALWTNLVSGQPQMIGVFADRVLLSLVTLVVIAGLLLTGIERRAAFLTRGNLGAPVGGEVASGKKRVMRWSLLGPLMAISLGGLFFTFLVGQIPTGMSHLGAIIPWVPLILVSAALNAFGEEATFRAAPLATLQHAIGPGHALWLTSLWFGLGHYYGGFPSGPAGLVQSGLLGLLMGKAMLDTRGIGMPWFIHLVIDTAIYTFMALVYVTI